LAGLPSLRGTVKTHAKLSELLKARASVIEAVDDGRELPLASRDLRLRDVREPFLVGDRSLEVAVDEVLRRWNDLAKG
jgi:hypothetical protein